MSARRPHPTLFGRHRIVGAILLPVLLLLAAEWLVRTGGWTAVPPLRSMPDIYHLTAADLPGAPNPYAPVKEFMEQSGLIGEVSAPPKRLGAVRIFSLGDSTTAGSGVNPAQTYGALLEVSLREQGLDAEVTTFAMPGSCLWQQRMLVEQMPRMLQPDLLILYTAPDLRADYHVLRFVLRHGLPSPPPAGGLDRSHLWRLLHGATQPPDFSAVLDQFFPDEDTTIELSDFMEDARDDLKTIQSLAAEQGARLLLAPVLTRTAFVQGLAEGLTSRDPEWRRLLADTNESLVLLTVTPELDLPAVHFGDAFLAAATHTELFLDEARFSSAGHAVAAEVLSRTICHEKLLPIACSAEKADE